MPGTGSSEAPAAESFGDRLAAAVAGRESQVVLGLDPDPAHLWEGVAADDTVWGRDRVVGSLFEARRRLGASGSEGAASAAGAAAATLAHCRAVIAAAGPACVAVKPQVACFERLGGYGWLALEAVCRDAQAAGLLVLADAKRGDVPVTAAAYAQAFLGATPSPFGAIPGLGADALTVNPLLGADAVAPLAREARGAGLGLFALVRTSNFGAADVMDARLAGGEPLWELLARMVDDLGREGRGRRSGLSDVGAVTGATAPEHLARMRELMPHAPFLLPGVGAQGGDVARLGPAFTAVRGAALVTASRSIVNAHQQHPDTAATAARREAERLRAAAWAL